MARHRVTGFRDNAFFPVNTLMMMCDAVAAESPAPSMRLPNRGSVC
jgi:hypothetical protein